MALVNNSLEIASMYYAHYYLVEIHNFHASELEYLLQFKTTGREDNPKLYPRQALAGYAAV